MRPLSLLPACTAFFAVASIVLCQILAHNAGHIPSWLVCAPISLAGYAMPERAVYGAAFSLVTVLFALMAGALRRLVLRFMEPQFQRLLQATSGTAGAAFLGLLVQGVVPLQSNVLDVLDPPNGKAPGVNAQSMVHQSAAAVFFGMSFIHAALVLLLLAKSQCLPNALTRMRCSWWAKLSCMVIAVLPAVVAFLWHPSAGDGSRVALNLGGVSQWVAVASMIAFYASYSLDFVALQAAARRHDVALHGSGAELRGKDAAAGDDVAAAPAVTAATPCDRVGAPDPAPLQSGGGTTHAPISARAGAAPTPVARRRGGYAQLARS